MFGRHTTVERIVAVFISEDETRSYNVTLDVETDENDIAPHLRVREHCLPYGPCPPDGNYIRQPHEFDAEPKKVHLQCGVMMGGWI